MLVDAEKGESAKQRTFTKREVEELGITKIYPITLVRDFIMRFKLMVACDNSAFVPHCILNCYSWLCNKVNS